MLWSSFDHYGTNDIVLESTDETSMHQSIKNMTILDKQLQEKLKTRNDIFDL